MRERSEQSGQFFLGRSAELAIIGEKVDRLGIEHQPVVIIRGEPGIGKTALLNQVAGELRQRLDMKMAIIDASLESHAPHSCMLELFGQITGKTSSREAKLNTTFTEIGIFSDQGEYGKEYRGLIKDVLRGLDKKKLKLVIGVDNLSVCDWSKLSEIDQYFLFPLAGEKNILFILAEDRKGYPYKTPEIDPLAQAITLEGLAKAETRQLLESHNLQLQSAELEEVISISGGNPFIALTLAQAPDLTDELTKLVEIFTPPNLEQADEFLKKFCVFDAIDEDKIRALMKPAGSESCSYAEAMRIRRNFCQAGLISYDEVSVGYIIPENWRRVIEEQLKRTDLSAWKDYQKAAGEYYLSLVFQYPQAEAEIKQRWLKKAQEHKEKSN